jgi:hypothetical protein
LPRNKLARYHRCNTLAFNLRGNPTHAWFLGKDPDDWVALGIKPRARAHNPWNGHQFFGGPILHGHCDFDGPRDSHSLPKPRLCRSLLFADLDFQRVLRAADYRQQNCGTNHSLENRFHIVSFRE